MSVYLCGFMGCGKSHIGRMLAENMDMRFVDLDKHIVRNEGLTIPEIFERFGEPHFRALEAKYIKELSSEFVVATGGGALLNDETAKFAMESGISVYINTSFEICYARIKGDKNRPLVVKNTLEQLRELYNTRAPIYRKNSVYMVNGNARDYIIAGEIEKLAKFSENNRRSL